MSPSYKTNDPRGWGGDPKRGAALGRRTVHDAPRDAAVRLTIRRVPLNQGGYDRNGTYYGTGAPLFWYADDNGEIDAVVRAKDIEEAKAKALAVYPHATFKR